jgi:hypothetical protein
VPVKTAPTAEFGAKNCCIGSSTVRATLPSRTAASCCRGSCRSSARKTSHQPRSWSGSTSTVPAPRLPSTLAGRSSFFRDDALTSPFCLPGASTTASTPTPVASDIDEKPPSRVGFVSIAAELFNLRPIFNSRLRDGWTLVTPPPTPSTHRSPHPCEVEPNVPIDEGHSEQVSAPRVSQMHQQERVRGCAR